MRINAVDHINIITNDLEKTANFYTDVLGMERGESPGAAMGFQGAWMFDSAGNAIVHIIWKNPETEFGAEHHPGEATAAVHHVAFRCTDYDTTLEKLDRLNVEYRASGQVRNGVRQIFLRDPNNINIELNFPQ